MNEANVNVTATDENNVTALNVAQNTRILKRMITQFTTTRDGVIHSNKGNRRMRTIKCYIYTAIHNDWKDNDFFIRNGGRVVASKCYKAHRRSEEIYIRIQMALPAATAERKHTKVRRNADGKTLDQQSEGINIGRQTDFLAATAEEEKDTATQSTSEIGSLCTSEA